MRHIALFGVPRSGTTWLGQLLNAHPAITYCYQPLFSYEFKNYLSPGFSAQEVQNFHHALLQAKSDFVLPENCFEKTTPTALLYKNVRYHNLAKQLLLQSEVKILYISRDPISVLNSWYNAPREFYPEWNIHEEWEYAPAKNGGRPEEFFGFDGWARAELIHRENARLFPERVKIVCYEDLVGATLSQTRAIFEWLGMELDPQVASFIQATGDRQDNSTYSVFKSPSPVTLTAQIQEQIIQRTKQLTYVDYYA
jgi:hypothetical protein